MEAWVTGEACPSLRGKPSCSPALGRGALAAGWSSPQAPAKVLSPGTRLLPEDAGCQGAVAPFLSLRFSASPRRAQRPLAGRVQT